MDLAENIIDYGRDDNSERLNIARLELDENEIEITTLKKLSKNFENYISHHDMCIKEMERKNVDTSLLKDLFKYYNIFMFGSDLGAKEKIIRNILKY